MVGILVHEGYDNCIYYCIDNLTIVKFPNVLDIIENKNKINGKFF